MTRPGRRGRRRQAQRRRSACGGPRRRRRRGRSGREVMRKEVLLGSGCSSVRCFARCIERLGTRAGRRGPAAPCTPTPVTCSTWGTTWCLKTAKKMVPPAPATPSEVAAAAWPPGRRGRAQLVLLHAGQDELEQLADAWRRHLHRSETGRAQGPGGGRLGTADMGHHEAAEAPAAIDGRPRGAAEGSRAACKGTNNVAMPAIIPTTVERRRCGPASSSEWPSPSWPKSEMHSSSAAERPKESRHRPRCR